MLHFLLSSDTTVDDMNFLEIAVTLSIIAFFLLLPVAMLVPLSLALAHVLGL